MQISVTATIQHALARGIETVYQLEEGEILAEPTPTRKDRRALFFFEAAEGGAGALSRLINEKDGFRSIARAALESMHYASSTFEEALASGPIRAQERARRALRRRLLPLPPVLLQPAGPRADRPPERAGASVPPPPGPCGGPPPCSGRPAHGAAGRLPAARSRAAHRRRGSHRSDLARSEARRNRRGSRVSRSGRAFGGQGRRADRPAARR